MNILVTEGISSFFVIQCFFRVSSLHQKSKSLNFYLIDVHGGETWQDDLLLQILQFVILQKKTSKERHSLQ